MRTPDGGARISWGRGCISVNAACLRMLHKMDGRTPLLELLAAGGWNERQALPLIEGLALSGLVELRREQVKRERRGWIKTTRMVAVSVEINQRCNQNCKRCYLSEARPEAEQLTIQELSDLFSDLGAYGVTSVCLSGGEPLLRQDLLHIVRLAKKSRLQVAIASNGTLLTGQVARDLVNAGVQAVQISVDGLAETHDGTRRSPGAFAALKQTFQACGRSGLIAYAITGITDKNVDELVALSAVLADWGAQGQLLPRYIPSGVADEDFDCVTREKLLVTLRALRRAHRVPPLSCDPVINRALGRHGRCGAGYNGASISTDGSVKICDALPHYVGSVREQEIGEIFESSPFVQRLVQRHQNLDMCPELANDPCYGCVAYQFLSHGTLDGQDMHHPAATCAHQNIPRAISTTEAGTPYVPELAAASRSAQ